MTGPNAVELLGYYGGDITHAASAWTSTTREMTPERIERIPKLFAMLAGETPRHETPFEKSMIHFLVRSDIASHIHIIKHRIGVSVNAESARYKELKEGNAYIPADWPERQKEILRNHIAASQARYHDTIAELVGAGLDRKRAKESARFFLPYAAQITADVSFNFRSFVHFQELRNHPAAQLEIREIAAEMLRLVKSIQGEPFKHSLQAFGL